MSCEGHSSSSNIFGNPPGVLGGSSMVLLSTAPTLDEDVIISEPNDDLVISNTYVDLPTLDFPSYEEASKVFELALEELKKARELGNQEEIKKMVSKSKRANFTRRNSLRSKDGKVNIWIQTIKIGDIIFQGLPVEPFMEFSHKIKSLNQIVDCNKNDVAGNLYFKSPIEPYTKEILNRFKDINKLKIVWDPGNGAISPIIHRIVKTIGGNNIILNRSIDSTFPNHHPDPTIKKNIIQISEYV